MSFTGGAASHAGSHASHAYAALQLPSRQLQFGDPRVLAVPKEVGPSSSFLLGIEIISKSMRNVIFCFIILSIKRGFISTLLHVKTQNFTEDGHVN